MENSPTRNIPILGTRKSSALDSLDNSAIRGSLNVDSSFKSTPRALQSIKSAQPQRSNDENACPAAKRIKQQQQQQHDELSIIPQTFTTSHHRQRVELTRHHRPSIGGKTVAAMRHLNRAGQKKRSTPKDDIHHLSTEELKLLSRRIDPSAPLASPHASPSKPALPKSLSPSQATNSPAPAACTKRHPSSSLYQTCDMIWSGRPPLLDELRHDNIKFLSQLLKVRLSQAKVRVLGSVENHDMNDLPALCTKHEAVRLSSKRHQCIAATVSGNSRHLFERQSRGRNRRYEARVSVKDIDNMPIFPGTSSKQSTSANASPSKTRKNSKKTPVKRHSASTKGITPVVQEDGSRVFVCEPCGKRYKNRNGLAYHLDRCQHRQEEQINNQQQDELVDEDEDEDSTESQIQCVCDNPQQQSGTLVQCDMCHTWQHMKCVDSQQELGMDYQCPSCLDSASASASSERPPAPPRNEDDEEDELAEDDDDSMTEKPVEDANHESPEPSQFADEAIEDDIFLTLSNSESFTNSELNDDSQQQSMSEPWTRMMGSSSQDDTTFASIHDSTFQTWGLSDLGLLNPPSLLFSDNTANDEDINLPPSDIVPAEVSQSDALWFEFANFDDDYQCNAV